LIVADPVKAMLIKIWSYIPTILGAIVILVIGWIIAKFVEAIVVRALKAARLDVVSDKAGIANMLARAFIAFNNEISRKDISDAIYYIERQLHKTETELRIKEETLKKFQQENRLVEMSTESDIQIQKLSNIEIELQNTSIKIVENSERINQLKKMLRREKMYVDKSLTFDNTLESKLIQLNMELARALAEFGEEHRRVKFLKENINQLTELAKKSEEGRIQVSS